jgi:hypothetical protein
MARICAEDLVGPERAEWYSLTPDERFRESTKLWDTYFALGGSFDTEPDTQSPFVRVLRRGGVLAAFSTCCSFSSSASLVELEAARNGSTFG